MKRTIVLIFAFSVLSPGSYASVFDYGIVSAGPVQLGMNTTVVGVYDAGDGSVYSAAPGLAVSCGSGHITGDVCVSDPNATTSLGGTQVDGGVHYNAPQMAMPAVDGSAYRALAKNIMNSPAPPTGTYTNIVIPPNTNPRFNYSVTIQGVMYVQSPNTVYFNNDCNFTGVLIADDQAAGTGDANNYIFFKNNMSFYGAEHLPDQPQFDALKQMVGTVILCPGFTMEFKNNLTFVDGIMAVKALTAKNNLDSTFNGNLLIYGAGGVDFKNNTDLTLNVAISGSTTPPGFVPQEPPSNLAPVVSAGSDQIIPLSMSTTLSGWVTDDGLPNPPAALTTTWTMTSGPAKVVFGNANATTTNVRFSKFGTYVLRLTASDSDLSSFGEVTIQVHPNPPGDFNGDGHVDGTDFLIWQRGYAPGVTGKTKSQGDANGDGVVDGMDFLLWQVDYSCEHQTF